VILLVHSWDGVLFRLLEYERSPAEAEEREHLALLATSLPYGAVLELLKKAEELAPA